jgi:hypothetical protein
MNQHLMISPSVMVRPILHVIRVCVYFVTSFLCTNYKFKTMFDFFFIEMFELNASYFDVVVLLDSLQVVWIRSLYINVTVFI